MTFCQLFLEKYLQMLLQAYMIWSPRKPSDIQINSFFSTSIMFFIGLANAWYQQFSLFNYLPRVSGYFVLEKSFFPYSSKYLYKALKYYILLIYQIELALTQRVQTRPHRATDKVACPSNSLCSNPSYFSGEYSTFQVRIFNDLCKLLGLDRPREVGYISYSPGLARVDVSPEVLDLVGSQADQLLPSYRELLQRGRPQKQTLNVRLNTLLFLLNGLFY